MSEETRDVIRRRVTVKGVEVDKGGEDTDRPWTKYTLIDENDKKQSTFDKKVGMLIKSSVGEELDIEVEKKGKFWNLVAAKPAEGPAPQAAPKPAASGNGTGGYYSRDPESELRIAREAALHAVTRLYAGSGTEFGSVLHLADRAVRWIYSGNTSVLADSLKPTASEPDGDPMLRAARETFDPDKVPGEAQPYRVTTKIVGITYKETNGGKNKRFTIQTSGEETYYTFSETIALALKKARDDKAMVTLIAKATDYGIEVQEVAEIKGGVVRGEPVVVPS